MFFNMYMYIVCKIVEKWGATLTTPLNQPLTKVNKYGTRSIPFHRSFQSAS